MYGSGTHRVTSGVAHSLTCDITKSTNYHDTFKVRSLMKKQVDAGDTPIAPLPPCRQRRGFPILQAGAIV